MGESLTVDLVLRVVMGGGGRLRAWRPIIGEGRSRMEGEEPLRGGVARP